MTQGFDRVDELRLKREERLAEEARRREEEAAREAEERQLVESALRPVRRHRPIGPPGASWGSGRAYAPRSAARAPQKPAVA